VGHGTVRHATLAIATALLLLTACGGAPAPPKTAPTHPRLTPTATPTPTLYLGSASPPPAPLVSQAQSICGEAAGIAKTEWNIFLSEINILSGYQPS
jgi:hypothetical protein